MTDETFPHEIWADLDHWIEGPAASDLRAQGYMKYIRSDRIEELEIENTQLRGLLCRLVFCEDAEFYPSAIESASPYCIDFEQWYEDAIKLLTGDKDE